MINLGMVLCMHPALLFGRIIRNPWLPSFFPRKKTAFIDKGKHILRNCGKKA